MRKRFFVDFAQPFDRGVGVRGRLEVGQESIDPLIAPAKLANSLVDLPADALPGQPPAGAEAAIIAERATAHGHGAIDVRASEMRVDADFLHAGAETVPQKVIVAVVAQSGGRPVEVRGSCHGGAGCQKTCQFRRIANQREALGQGTGLGQFWLTSKIAATYTEMIGWMPANTSIISLIYHRHKRRCTDMHGELIPVGGGDPIPLLKKNLLVGRRESCDIVLRFSNVSAHHCQLTCNGGYWYVKDLQSRNGIKVNGSRVTEKRFDPGDELSIAKHTIRRAVFAARLGRRRTAAGRRSNGGRHEAVLAGTGRPGVQEQQIAVELRERAAGPAGSTCWTIAPARSRIRIGPCEHPPRKTIAILPHLERTFLNTPGQVAFVGLGPST